MKGSARPAGARRHEAAPTKLPIEKIAKLVAAREGDKITFFDRESCAQGVLCRARFRKDIELSERDGRIALLIGCDAPPMLGNLEHFAMARLAAVATGPRS